MTHTPRCMFAASLLLVCGFVKLAHASQTDVLLDMKLQSLRMTKAALQTHMGVEPAFAELRAGRERLRADMDAVTSLRSNDNCVNGLPADLSANLNQMDAQNRNLLASSDMILKHEAEIKAIRQAMLAIDAAQPELSELVLTVHEELLQNHGSTRQLSLATRMVFFHERLVVSADRFVKDDVLNPEVAFVLFKDMITLRQVIDALLTGAGSFNVLAVKTPGAVKQLNALSKRLEPLEQQVKFMSDHLQATVEIKQASLQMQETARGLDRVLDAIRGQVNDKPFCNFR